MKKPIKIAIMIVALLASVVGGIYYMTLPISVRMVKVSAKTAELYFTEQGVVAAEKTIQVYSSVQGALDTLFAREGQLVAAGDRLLSVDDSGFRLQKEQIENGIKSLEAQLAGVDVEDAAMRSNLTATRNMLQGELLALNAQATQSDQAFASQQELQSEQVRVQQILIDQQQSVLDKAMENLERIEELYLGGVLPRIDYEDAGTAVAFAESQLDAAKGQMAIIVASAPESSTEHFEGLRASINAQIAGINQQLAQNTTQSSKAHFEAMIAIEESKLVQLDREIANAVVTAPASGIVTVLHAQGTNYISVGVPVAEITVPGSLSIDVYVSTQDIDSIEIGEIVGLTLRRRSGDIAFQGIVAEVDSTAVVRLSALGVEERKVKVGIQPQLPDDLELGLGHAVDVTFHIFKEEDRFIVPRMAIFRDNGQEMVWAVRGSDSGVVEAIAVVTGMELRTDIIIESGLEEGDHVVSDANNPDLRNGRKVKPG